MTSIHALTHPANDRLWQIGDLVIHDCDAKECSMLMKVIAVDGEIYTTVYVCPNTYDWCGGRQWTSTGEWLHAPERFGIDIAESGVAWQA